MTMKAWIIGGTAAMIVLVAVGAAMFFTGWGKAMYRPGDLAAKAAKGLISLEPFGRIVSGARRGDGTQEFSLEAEKGIVLAGFRRGEGRPAIVIFGGPGYPIERGLAGTEALRIEKMLLLLPSARVGTVDAADRPFLFRQFPCERRRARREAGPRAADRRHRAPAQGHRV